MPFLLRKQARTGLLTVYDRFVFIDEVPGYHYLLFLSFIQREA
jgi:hypothetical protein